MGADTRRRMIRSAALLFREHGYSGTGFRDVIEHSGAPRGSIYHHFPGGKAQLAEEAVRYSADFAGRVVEAPMREGDPLAAVRLFIEGWRVVLESSEFRAGCPIVAVATEAHAENPRLATAAAEAFARWQSALAASLRKSGVGRARAARLGTLAVAAIEGAIVLCRAQRDTAPLDEVGRELDAAIRAALPG